MKLTIDEYGHIDLITTLESGRSSRHGLGFSSHEAGDTLDGLLDSGGIDEEQVHQLFPTHITLRLDSMCLDEETDSPFGGRARRTTTFRSRVALLGLAISHWIESVRRPDQLSVNYQPHQD